MFIELTLPSRVSTKSQPFRALKIKVFVYFWLLNFTGTTFLIGKG